MMKEECMVYVKKEKQLKIKKFDILMKCSV